MAPHATTVEMNTNAHQSEQLTVDTSITHIDAEANTNFSTIPANPIHNGNTSNQTNNNNSKPNERKRQRQPKLKLTILNLYGIKIRNNRPRPNAILSPSQRRISQQNREKQPPSEAAFVLPTPSSCDSSSSSPPLTDEICITASVTFTGSSCPSDMRVVSSTICPDSGLLFVESRPVVIPCGMNEGLVATWDDSRDTRLAPLQRPQDPSFTTRDSNGSGGGGGGTGRTDYSNVTSPGGENTIGTKKGSIAAMPQSTKPHLFVKLGPSSTDRDVTSSAENDVNNADTTNDNNNNVINLSHRDLVTSNTSATDDLLNINHNPSTHSTYSSMSVCGAELDETDISSTLSRSQHESNSSDDMNTKKNSSDSHDNNNNNNTDGTTTASTTHPQRQASNRTVINPPPRTPPSNSATNSSSSQQQQQQQQHDPHKTSSEESSALPEILEMQIILNAKQIPYDNDTEDLSALNIKSACCPGSGFVAHLVLFEDVFKSSSGSVIHDDPGGKSRLNEDKLGDEGGRLLEIPIRKQVQPFVSPSHSSRDLFSSNSSHRQASPSSSFGGGGGRMSGSQRSLGGDSSRRSIYNNNNNRRKNEAWIDLEENASIMVRLEHCTDEEDPFENEAAEYVYQEKLNLDAATVINTKTGRLDTTYANRHSTNMVNSNPQTPSNDLIKSPSEMNNLHRAQTQEQVAKQMAQSFSNLKERTADLWPNKSGEDGVHSQIPNFNEESYICSKDNNADKNTSTDNDQTAAAANKENENDKNNTIFCGPGLDLEGLINAISNMVSHCAEDVPRYDINGTLSMDSTIYTSGSI